MNRKYLCLCAFLLYAAGAAASTAPSYTAVVDSDGTLARGNRAVSAKHLNTGRYTVSFSRDVTACSYTASVGLSGDAGSADHGTVSVAQRSGAAKSILVETFDMTGALSDRGFHVIVAC